MKSIFGSHNLLYDKNNTLFQIFIMHITLKYVTPIIRHLLNVKVFHNHMLLLFIFIKETKA